MASIRKLWRSCWRGKPTPQQIAEANEKKRLEGRVELLEDKAKHQEKVAGIFRQVGYSGSAAELEQKAEDERRRASSFRRQAERENDFLDAYMGGKSGGK